MKNNKIINLRKLQDWGGIDYLARKVENKYEIIEAANWSAIKGDIDLLKILINAAEENKIKIDHKQALLLALEYNQQNIIDYLNNITPLNYQDDSWYKSAFIGGNAEIIDKIIDKGKESWQPILIRNIKQTYIKYPQVLEKIKPALENLNELARSNMVFEIQNNLLLGFDFDIAINAIKSLPTKYIYPYYFLEWRAIQRFAQKGKTEAIKLYLPKVLSKWHEPTIFFLDSIAIAASNNQEESLKYLLKTFNFYRKNDELLTIDSFISMGLTQNSYQNVVNAHYQNKEDLIKKAVEKSYKSKKSNTKNKVL